MEFQMEKQQIPPVFFGSALQDGAQRPLAKVEQYVMAYRANQDQINALLPEGFRSLRPVLRINVELLSHVVWLADRAYARIEFNTPIEYKEKRGWLNLVTWENDCDSVIFGRELCGIPKLYGDISVKKEGAATKIEAASRDFSFLDLSFTKVGKEGGCPREDDNDGTFYYRSQREVGFIPVEVIEEKREYCDCSFQWNEPTFAQMPAACHIPKKICAIENEMILGAYTVTFDRTKSYSDLMIL